MDIFAVTEQKKRSRKPAIVHETMNHQIPPSLKNGPDDWTEQQHRA